MPATGSDFSAASDETMVGFALAEFEGPPKSTQNEKFHWAPLSEIIFFVTFSSTGPIGQAADGVYWPDITFYWPPAVGQSLLLDPEQSQGTFFCTEYFYF